MEEVLEGFFNDAIIWFSGKTDWMFMKILTDYREFLWTRKSSLNCETRPDLYGLKIRSADSPWRSSAFCE